MNGLTDRAIDATCGMGLVVLDAHGVVFNRGFPIFVRQRAIDRCDDPGQVWARWRDDHRLDFWEGRITPTEMWAGLFPGDHPSWLTAELEQRFEPGPLFDFVNTSDQRMWMLSNHCSDWLLPRLQRFGIADRFERILVSDQLGAAKPDPAAFAPITAVMRSTTACLLDDSTANVGAARALGIEAHLVATNRRPARVT